jgi:ABC-type multidrug transport system fused ATPase/permease subunit
MAEIGLLFLPLLYGEILNIVEGTRTFPKGYFITLLFLTIILLFLRSFSGYFNGKIKVDIHENISLESIKKIFKIPPVKLAEKGSKYYTDIILERSSEAADIFDFNSMTGFLNLIKLIVITGIILFLDITIFFVSIILVLLSL